MSSFIYLALLVLPLQVCASFITLLLAWFTKSRGSVDPDLDALLQLKAKFHECIRSGGARLYFVDLFIDILSSYSKKGEIERACLP